MRFLRALRASKQPCAPPAPRLRASQAACTLDTTIHMNADRGIGGGVKFSAPYLLCCPWCVPLVTQVSLQTQHVVEEDGRCVCAERVKSQP